MNSKNVKVITSYSVLDFISIKNKSFPLNKSYYTELWFIYIFNINFCINHNERIFMFIHNCRFRTLLFSNWIIYFFIINLWQDLLLFICNTSHQLY